MENILESRVTKSGKVEYLVKWETLETTWEPADNLQSVHNLISKFEQEIKTQVNSLNITDDTGISCSISAAARQEAEQAAENYEQSDNDEQLDNDELFVDVNTVEEVVLEVEAAKSEIQVVEVKIKPDDSETCWEGIDEYVENAVAYRLKVIGIDAEKIEIMRDNLGLITTCLVKMKVTQLKKIEEDTFPFKNWATKTVHW